MKVYLLRHGEALGKPSGRGDEARELSAHGRNQISALAEALKQAQVHFEVIFTSPYVRARQTAEIIAQRVSKNVPPVPLEELASGKPDAQTILHQARENEKAQALLFVGHMPEFGEIISRLTQTTAAFSLKPGTLCCLQLAPPFDDRQPAPLTLYVDSSDPSALGKIKS